MMKRVAGAGGAPAGATLRRLHAPVPAADVKYDGRVSQALSVTERAGDRFRKGAGNGTAYTTSMSERGWLSTVQLTTSMSQRGWQHLHPFMLCRTTAAVLSRQGPGQMACPAPLRPYPQPACGAQTTEAASHGVHRAPSASPAAPTVRQCKLYCGDAVLAPPKPAPGRARPDGSAQRAPPAGTTPTRTPGISGKPGCV